MEILVNINHNTDIDQYSDGDVIRCFPPEEILVTRAQTICNAANFGFNSHGLRELGTLLEKYQQKTSKFKFIRLNSNNVLKRNLITGEEIVVSNTANEEGERIHTEAFLKRRLARPKHKIFGNSQGREIWYSNSIYLINRMDLVDAIWNDIETETGILKADNTRKHFTRTEKRNFLVLDCTGFIDNEYKDISMGTAVERSNSVINPIGDNEDQEYEILAKRRWNIPYFDLATELGIDINKVRDPSKLVDPRQDIPREQKNKLDDIMIDKVNTGEIII